jgi:uncharacterized protein (TIGR03437 family)
VRFYPAIVLVCSPAWLAYGQSYTISTVAGGALPIGVAGTAASLGANSPRAVASDPSGNLFFVNQNTVLRLDAATGILTLVAGTGVTGFGGDNGPATSALLRYPSGLAVDSTGDLYIADSGNLRIRKVANGMITSVAGNGITGYSGDNGPATTAELNNPVGIAVDSAGNMYIADYGNNRIRKVANGVITTVAGSGMAGFSGDGGAATSGALGGPDAIAADGAGNLYVTDSTNRVRKVSNGIITTFAGTGTAGFSGDNVAATSVQLNTPNGLAVDSNGNVYISDNGNDRVRKVANGIISTVAGTGTTGFSGDNGPAASAQIDPPFGVAVDSAGNLYICDLQNGRIRKVSHGVITTVAGNGMQGFGGDSGPAVSAQLNSPQGIVADSAGNLYIADTDNNRVRRVKGGVITTVAGNGTAGYSGDGGPAISAALFMFAYSALALDSQGNLYIDDSGNGCIRKVSNGMITTIAGGGSLYDDNVPSTSAHLFDPSGVAVDANGDLYISDITNSRIRRVSNGIITTVAGTGVDGFSGDGGPATTAQLNSPRGIALDGAGNLYIADSGNARIRKVSGGLISTVAGNFANPGTGDGGPATSAGLYFPASVAVSSSGDLYIADYDDYRIRKVSSGIITTVAGTGVDGFSGDGGPAASAQLSQPAGIALGSNSSVYVADLGNQRIRLLSPAPAPAITQGGIVPIFSSVSAIQPGSWVSIYGSGFASSDFVWNGDFPTSLGGVSVFVDNKPAYLWLVSPSQINLQAPDDAVSGPVNVVVATPYGTATSTVSLSRQAPSFSLLGDGMHAAGVILTPDGTGSQGAGTYDLEGPSGAFSFYTRPVKAGETLVLYGVGFGPTTPAVPAGALFSGAAPTNYDVTITIGGVQAAVAFAGITGAGLYQFNLTMPANTGSGDQPLAATVTGVRTPAGPVIAVQ